ncbi:unnamed protein product [Clonostachys solani]|uniref:Uncharacterized protein n=1 Tax=Clonostachys solani TaxID=160281 RepID=A0A9N9Z8X3_9HYPO|nr:unnamed protein product [Clonostachys solani]
MRSVLLTSPHMGYADEVPMNTWYAETAENVERWLRGQDCPQTTKRIVRFLGPTKDGNPAFLDFKKGHENMSIFGPSLDATVDATNLHDFMPPATLASEGIEWYVPRSKIDSMFEGFIRGSYFDECTQLVKPGTGASQAVAYNFRHRRIEKRANNYFTLSLHRLILPQVPEHEPHINLFDPYSFSAKPLPNFHVDNNAETVATNLKRVLGNEEAERWLLKDWGIVNVWRNVGDMVRQRDREVAWIDLFRYQGQVSPHLRTHQLCDPAQPEVIRVESIIRGGQCANNTAAHVITPSSPWPAAP